MSCKQSQNASVRLSDSQLTFTGWSYRFCRSAQSTIITLKYYNEKGCLKIFHQVSTRSTVPKPPFVRNMFKRSRRVRKLPLSNWYLEQGQRWQLNNATFNLSQRVMSNCCGRFPNKQWQRAGGSAEPNGPGERMKNSAEWRLKSVCGEGSATSPPERVTAQPHLC